MIELNLNQNKKIHLEEGYTYLMICKTYQQEKNMIDMNNRVFACQTSKYTYYSFTRRYLLHFEINFISFKSVFKRFGFSKNKSIEALNEMKYYVRKELEKRHDPEARIRYILSKYDLNKNASGLWNIAKLILWFIISKKCSQTILIRCNGIGYYNIIGSYQILTEMLSGTALTAIMLYIDSNLAENDIKLEKLTEKTFRSFMGLKEGDSLNDRGR